MRQKTNRDVFLIFIEFRPGGGQRGGGTHFYTLFWFTQKPYDIFFFLFCKLIDINEFLNTTELFFSFSLNFAREGPKGGVVPTFTLYFDLLENRMTIFFFCILIDINEF